VSLRLPHAAEHIDWFGHHINMKATRDQAKSAPALDPLATMDEVRKEQLHRQSGWPGYGRSMEN
jgi:hypothetical protein